MIEKELDIRVQRNIVKLERHIFKSSVSMPCYFCVTWMRNWRNPDFVLDN